jgi:hypothetical protein
MIEATGFDPEERDDIPVGDRPAVLKKLKEALDLHS